ncbi:Fur family transcriptional regulator [Georgenia sp. AZ-5]|uniref:Fur family transcriptional regulator n=1 Tax=Georgenia sp. AZ-5 TaxID=3367526 RepID=UPI003754964B
MAGTAEELRAAGLRVTAQRAAVLDVLTAASDEHLSAAEVAERVRARLGTISTQGVYDCLEALLGAHLVRRVDLAGHAALFETARAEGDHHHLLCRRCGVVRDVDRAAGACGEVPAVPGFAVESAEVTFVGLCPTCASAADQPSRPAAN